MPRSSSRRPAPAPAARRAPAASQTRQASTMAAPAPTYSSPAHPAAAAPQQPGLFAQMASTAAGVAVGSAVGHTIGAGLTGMFSGSSSQPVEQQQQLQAAPVQQQSYQQEPARACDADARTFTRCLEESDGNMQACDFYLQQLKACQAAARQY